MMEMEVEVADTKDSGQKKQREMLREVFDQMPQAVIVTGRKGAIKGVNPAAAELFGMHLEELRRCNVLELFVTRDLQPDGARIRAMLTSGGEIRNKETYILKGGARRAVRLNVSYFRDAARNIVAVIGTLTDVNDLVFAAYHDGLTGVMNWSALERAVPNEVRAALAEERPFGLIVADTDDFKAKNDAYGHIVGDALLKSVAEVLGQVAGPTMVGRSGGDEFMVLVRGDEAAVGQAAQHILHGLRAMTVPFQDPHDAHPILLSATASIGWAMLGDVQSRNSFLPGADETERAISLAERLRDCADIATYQAKDKGKNRIVRFHLSMSRPARPSLR